jgi:hypothetical protein
MELKEIREEKKKLESEIQMVISELTDKFAKTTNMGICEIYIPMIDVTSLGDDVSKYVVGHVRTEVERI